MTAPFVYEGAMNDNIFLAYVEQVLLPTHQPCEFLVTTICPHTKQPECAMPPSARVPS
jgi:hypothetical protein